MTDILINNVLPLSLSAIGGAMMIINIYTLIGKTDNLLGFEKKHFSPKALKTIAFFKAALGVVFAALLFFCASALLFEKQDKINLSLILLGSVAAIFFVCYAVLWFKMGKKK